MGAQRKKGRPEHPTGALRAALVTVANSSVATSTDSGAVALVLDTKESGPIGFQVTIESCAVLRCQIAIAEALLRKKRKEQGKTEARFRERAPSGQLSRHASARMAQTTFSRTSS